MALAAAYSERRSKPGCVVIQRMANGAHRAFATGHDHQIVTAGAAFKVIYFSCLDSQFPTTLLKVSHPAGNFEPLVDRLRKVLQARGPVDDFAADSIRHCEANAFDLWTFLLPVVQAEIAFNFQR